jgi:hypothetical protein
METEADVPRRRLLASSDPRQRQLSAKAQRKLCRVGEEVFVFARGLTTPSLTLGINHDALSEEDLITRIVQTSQFLLPIY